MYAASRKHRLPGTGLQPAIPAPLRGMQPSHNLAPSLDAPHASTCSAAGSAVPASLPCNESLHPSATTQAHAGDLIRATLGGLASTHGRRDEAALNLDAKGAIPTDSHEEVAAAAEEDSRVNWCGSGSEARLSELLHSVMGFRDFRGRQLEVIQRVLAGQSTLAVLPTGRQYPSRHALSVPQPCSCWTL